MANSLGRVYRSSNSMVMERVNMTTVVIPDTVWLLLIVWIVLIAFSHRDQIIGAFSGIFGIIFALYIMPTFGLWVGLVLLFVNFYLLYRALLVEDKGK